VRRVRPVPSGLITNRFQLPSAMLAMTMPSCNGGMGLSRSDCLPLGPGTRLLLAWPRLAGRYVRSDHLPRASQGLAERLLESRRRSRQGYEEDKCHARGASGGLSAESRPHLGDVISCFALADTQAAGDLIVRQALADESEDFPLPRGQHVGVCRPAAFKVEASIACRSRNYPSGTNVRQKACETGMAWADHPSMIRIQLTSL
jgi:hypothetical protein